MRVVIAEDSGLLRQLLADLLHGHGLTVCGQAGSVPELLRLVAHCRPDLCILDVRMPPDYSDEGLVAAESIRAGWPGVGLLVLSHYAETSYAVRLLELPGGGVGYLVKDRVQDGHRLIDAIHRVADGEVVVDPEVVQRVMRRQRVTDPLAILSPAEREVLALMAEGLSNSAIASRLAYSVKTVEKRVTSLSQKLGLPDPDAPDRGDVNLRVLAVLRYLRAAR
ncbi:response regulator [Blastococcus sp. SYSU D00669]